MLPEKLLTSLSVMHGNYADILLKGLPRACQEPQCASTLGSSNAHLIVVINAWLTHVVPPVPGLAVLPDQLQANHLDY